MYHAHVGHQLDLGLYGPLIVEPKDEPGDYDREYTLMLDDWRDGLGLPAESGHGETTPTRTTPPRTTPARTPRPRPRRRTPTRTPGRAWARACTRCS